MLTSTKTYTFIDMQGKLVEGYTHTEEFLKAAVDESLNRGGG